MIYLILDNYDFSTDIDLFCILMNGDPCDIYL